MTSFDKISVVGLGYVGLPTAAMFASRKVEVVGVDVNPETVSTINCGQIHIVEPDLDMVVHAAVTEGYLRATEKPEPAEAFLIAVPTPFKGAGNEPDLSYVEAASRAIAPVLEPGNIVILESTAPVGATETMADWLAEERRDLTFPGSHGEDSDIRIAHCPERVLPGNVMQELIANDRVIGGMTPLCSMRAAELYRLFVMGECVFATSPQVAEMAKLTENSFRDMNIAFANELSLICDKHGMNVWELIKLTNHHPRVNILKPGPGVGGHCIAVDPWFIVSSAPKESRLIRTAREVNSTKPSWVVEKVMSEAEKQAVSEQGKSASEISIACYGLTYKPDIDDLRESPALRVVEMLIGAHSGRVLVVEPNIDSLPTEVQGAELVSLESAQHQADIHVMLVSHREFLTSMPTSGVVLDISGIRS